MVTAKIIKKVLSKVEFTLTEINKKDCQISISVTVEYPETDKDQLN